jgi:hypothetical protein
LKVRFKEKTKIKNNNNIDKNERGDQTNERGKRKNRGYNHIT